MSRLIDFQEKRKSAGAPKAAAKLMKIVRSRDIDWNNRSIIEENNKVEWTSNMAGSSSQVSKQAFHETYELKEELGKWVFFNIDSDLVTTSVLILFDLYPRRGAFSIVRRCVHKETKVEYAAKIINTRKLSSRGRNPDLRVSWLCRINSFISSFFQKASPINLKKKLCLWFSTWKIVASQWSKINLRPKITQVFRRGGRSYSDKTTEMS